MVNETTPPAPTPPKLLDQVRDKIRVKHYSIRTETQYLQEWLNQMDYCRSRFEWLRANSSNTPQY